MSAEPRRWRIYPEGDGTLQAAPVEPAWGGGGIIAEEVTEPMVRASDHRELQQACAELLDRIDHLPGVHNPTWPVGAAAAKVRALL